MLALLLAITVAAPPASRLQYEAKCLYCHSEEVAESKRFTEPQWRRVIEQMRTKAPLLITRGDVGALTAYMTQTLKLVPPPAPVKPVVVKPEPVVPPVVTEAPPPPSELKRAPVVEPVEVAPEELSADAIALEKEGFELLQKRCSKCHTLGRVYGRLDTLERSLLTLKRMRMRTGSGITDHDMQVLEAYLRTQF
jgi:cytochrome c5